MTMAVPLHQGNDPRYTVPSWFLENNVRTKAEADDDEPGIAVVDDPLGKDEGEKRPAMFEILRDDYDAIQLTAAAALIRDEAGALPAKTPSTLLDMKNDGEPVVGGVRYFDCLVKQLAQDLGAGLISVRPDNLEELGRAFYLQDQERQEDTTKQQPREDSATEDTGIDTDTDEQAIPPEQPDWDSAYPLVQFYFGVRSERNETVEAQKRSKAAIDALLNSAQIKRRAALEKEPADDGSLDSIVLLHLMDLQLLDFKDSHQPLMNYGYSQKGSPRGRLLHRFASRIEERRTATKGRSQRILGIASETSSSLPNGECRKFLSDEHRTFQISLPPNYTAQKDLYMRSKSYYIRMRNIYRFKRVLQARLPKAFEPGLLDLYDSEHIQQRWQNEVFPGGKACSANDFDRAAIQVAGRQLKNPTLTLDDIIVVTTRMRRRGNWDSEEEPEEDKRQEKNEEQGSDKQNPWEGLTLKQRQDKVSPQCDDYESKLLNCIVNPEDLSTTYDDVIIDEETKEHVKQLVSLSRIRLEAASKTLLQNLCVSGALFYGAPGTGKTLLCKAIANDSSSNMLSLTPSDVQKKYIGETEKIISAAFSLAAKLSPCVLFIDEVDALFYRRSSCDKSWERSTLNQFLQEMDGLTAQNKGNAPFVIVGTNRPGDLDDAFLRRLPHKVLFTLPAAAERERILRIFLHDDDVDPLLDLNDLANRTKGFSGSDLRNLCGHAALAWAVEQTKNQRSRDVATIQVHLQKHHFDVALRKTKPTVSPKSTKVLEEFARQFNPEDYNRLYGSIDKSNVTSKTNSTPVQASLPSQAPPHPDGISHPRAHEMSSIYSASVAAAADRSINVNLEKIREFISDGPIPAELMPNIETNPGAVPSESVLNIPTERTDRPLGKVAEDWLGIVKTETLHQSSETTDLWSTIIIRGLTNWYRLQFVVSMGFADEVLSWEERYSYQVLFDWWSAAFQHPDIPLSYLWLSICGSDILVGHVTREEWNDHMEIWGCIASHFLKLLEAGGRPQDELDESVYSTTMWDLFLTEFCLTDIYFADGRHNKTALATTRGEAVRIAYYHQAAMKCFGCLLPGPPLHRTSEKSLRDLSAWVLSVEASDPSYPRTLSRGPLIRACPWLDPDPSTSGAYSQDITGDGDELGGWPEYLWDIANRRVVHTRDLQDKRPAYVAISHTWGRWQLKEENVQMEGGLELPVPCNSVFNVDKLPEILTKVKSLNDTIDVDYIWIDLLCIPQVPLGETTAMYEPWIPIQMREIARQGSIFRNAWAAVAWFHDIDSLSCIGALFELFSLSLLSFEPGSTDDMQCKSLEEAAYGRICQGRAGFLSKETDAGHSTLPRREQATPSSWFTSLWTLQEVCLRPDMWLMTSDLDILTVGQGEPVPLNGLVCVQLESGNSLGGPWKVHDTNVAMAELVTWAFVTGFVDLLELSQVDILRLGDRRHCSGKRAEAIMSAIGATKWFSRHSNHEENLILGKYPYEFIQEIRESISGKIFASYSKAPFADAHDEIETMKTEASGLHGRGLVQAYEAADICGSLLPFSSTGHVYFRGAKRSHKLDTHESVCSWEITTSGKVKIENACILSSSTLTDILKSPEVLPCDFSGFYVSADSYKKMRMTNRIEDMHRWTGARKSEIHLVVVMYKIMKKTSLQDNIFDDPDDPILTKGRHMIHGIVLRSTKADSLRTAKKEGRIQGADGKPQRLVKIGTFEASGSGEVVLPETRKVSWEIL